MRSHFAALGILTLALAAAAGADVLKPVLPTAPYKAGFFPSKPLPLFCQGGTAELTVRLVNQGTLAWDPQKGFHLSYHWLRSGAVIVYDGLRTDLGGVIASGKDVTLTHAKVKAPDAPGTYVLRLDMVQEGMTWFEDQASPPHDETVEVESRATCAVNVRLPDPFPPAIDTYSPLTWPGGFVVINGKNFGEKRGQVVLKGLANQGDVTLGGLHDAWLDTGIFMDVPSRLGGFRAGQRVRLQVVTASGRRSPEKELEIRPVLENGRAPNGTVRVKGCSGGASGGNGGAHHDCSDWAQALQPIAAEDALFFPNATACHFTPVSDGGTDVFSVAVPGDFELQRLDVYLLDLKANKLVPSVHAPVQRGFQAGGQTSTVSIDWKTTPGTPVCYGLLLWVYGPRGPFPSF